MTSLSQKNVIYDKQFGFRKDHSTAHAVDYSINSILKNREKNNHVIGIFIDLSKAFDAIDHEKLLTKLANYGIRGTSHNLIKDYMSNRIQYTDFQETFSEKCNNFWCSSGFSSWALTLSCIHQSYHQCFRKWKFCPFC
jgi:hypothetical protein